MWTHDIFTKFLYWYHEKTTAPDVIYIHGGGHFTDTWRIGAECLVLADKLFDASIIIRPSSCQFTESDPAELFESVESDVTFYCREQYSLSIMERVSEEVSGLSTAISDDTALYLSPDDFDIESLSDDYILKAFRTDRESSVNKNILKIESGGWEVVEEDVSLESSDLTDFASKIASAFHIYTDRLHVALTAAISGVSTTFYANSYHKNKDVF